MTNSENNKLQGSKNVQSGTSNFNKTYGVRDGVKKQGNNGNRENLSKTYDVRNNEKTYDARKNEKKYAVRNNERNHDKSPDRRTCRHKSDRSKVTILYSVESL